jgi:hypothetical protein
MWDNRLSKRNPKAPDFKCRNRSCDGVLWPPRVATTGTKSESTNLAIADQDQDANDIPF